MALENTDKMMDIFGTPKIEIYIFSLEFFKDRWDDIVNEIGKTKKMLPIYLNKCHPVSYARKTLMLGLEIDSNHSYKMIAESLDCIKTTIDTMYFTNVKIRLLNTVELKEMEEKLEYANFLKINKLKSIEDVNTEEEAIKLSNIACDLNIGKKVMFDIYKRLYDKYGIISYGLINYTYEFRDKFQEFDDPAGIGDIGDYAYQLYIREKEKGKNSNSFEWVYEILHAGIRDNEISGRFAAHNFTDFKNGFQAGCFECSYYLAELYEISNWLNEAYTWLEIFVNKSIETGKLSFNFNSDTLYKLANAYFIGKGKVKDIEEAYKWSLISYSIIASYRKSDKCKVLIESIEKMLPIEKQIEIQKKAKEISIMLSSKINRIDLEKGIVKSSCDTSDVSESVKDKNVENSSVIDKFQDLLKKAESGDEESQFQLAECYRFGNTIEVNYAKAFEWYTKSAKHKHHFAQFRLGACYQDGVGVEEDIGKAIKCFRRAAQNGNIEAQYHLVVLLADDFGDFGEFKDEAMKWLRLAAGHGHMESIKWLKELDPPNKKKHKQFSATSKKEIKSKKKEPILVKSNSYILKFILNNKRKKEVIKILRVVDSLEEEIYYIKDKRKKMNLDKPDCPKIGLRERIAIGELVADHIAGKEKGLLCKKEQKRNVKSIINNHFREILLANDDFVVRKDTYICINKVAFPNIELEYIK